MPVSKKRKTKSGKPRTTPQRTTARAPQSAAPPLRQALGGTLRELFPARAELDAVRTAHAATVADHFVAGLVIDTTGPRGIRRPVVLDARKAVAEFTAWLSARGRETEDLEDHVVELAETWGGTDQPAALYGTCSPHHVAHTVSTLREFFQDDFADELIALLPEWITWLAERTGMAPELVERCRPYAHGEPYPGLDYDDPAGLNSFARVNE